VLKYSLEKGFFGGDQTSFCTILLGKVLIFVVFSKSQKKLRPLMYISHIWQLPTPPLAFFHRLRPSHLLRVKLELKIVVRPRTLRLQVNLSIEIALVIRLRQWPLADELSSRATVTIVIDPAHVSDLFPFEARFVQGDSWCQIGTFEPFLGKARQLCVIHADPKGLCGIHNSFYYLLGSQTVDCGEAASPYRTSVVGVCPAHLILRDPILFFKCSPLAGIRHPFIAVAASPFQFKVLLPHRDANLIIRTPRTPFESRPRPRRMHPHPVILRISCVKNLRESVPFTFRSKGD